MNSPLHVNISQDVEDKTLDSTTILNSNSDATFVIKSLAFCAYTPCKVIYSAVIMILTEICF